MFNHFHNVLWRIMTAILTNLHSKQMLTVNKLVSGKCDGSFNSINMKEPALWHDPSTIMFSAGLVSV